MSELFTFTVAEAQWLASAAKDAYRPVFQKALVCRYNGECAIVTTDTYRLHLLRLGVQGGFPLADGEFRSLDIRRVVLEARFAKAPAIALSVDLTRCVLTLTDAQAAKRGVPKDFEEPIFAPVLTDADASIRPHFLRVVPETKRPVSELFAINARYLREATALARSENERVMLYQDDAPNRGIVFRPASDRWLAVVMPMATEGWFK